MTEQTEDVQQALLAEARRQTKALEGIYALCIVFALLSAVGLLGILLIR